jgi:hypothetical protein
MRWAYRRLALLGQAVDFVYTGPIAEARWVKTFYPLHGIVDAGWGYIAFPGTILESRSGGKWCGILGYARLMPEGIFDWVIEEASSAFLKGRLFVAPAPLLGLRSTGPGAHVGALVDVAKGTAAIEDLGTANAALDLEIPYIDGMTPSDFLRFVDDHEPELDEFRAAFRELTSGYGESSAASESARRRFTCVVNGLTRSARYEALRGLVERCRGVLRTFPVAMGLLAGVGAVYNRDPFSGVAVVAGAASVLRHMWLESRREAQAAGSHPLKILWTLGVDLPFYPKRIDRAEPHASPSEASSLKPGPCHWLCPPTAGLLVAGFKQP